MQIVIIFVGLHTNCMKILANYFARIKMDSQGTPQTSDPGLTAKYQNRDVCIHIEILSGLLSILQGRYTKNFIGLLILQQVCISYTLNCTYLMQVLQPPYKRRLISTVKENYYLPFAQNSPNKSHTQQHSSMYIKGSYQ